MSLRPGQDLSHYRLVKKLGEGGMGVVWEARDTVLERSVAIKVLPERFAEKIERRARFEREAKLLAALNHPNVAAIHGFETSGETRFLVLELIPGATLQERLQDPLSVDEALAICREIAEALEVAHAESIIHRDLKPSNVKVCPDGKIKVLDFGLAKAFATLPDGAEDDGRSPTISATHTKEGVILGTAAYMSPEQARALPVDKRCDIWSFGCVLYECLTGKRAFQGDSISDTLAGVLEREPDWTVLPPATPRSIRTLLRRCLQKDPSLRLHDIADARIEIDEAWQLELESHDVAELGFVERWRRVLIGSAIGLFLGIAATGSVAWWTLRSPPPAVRLDGRFAIPLLQEAPLPVRASARPFALSRDGRFLAWLGETGEGGQLYIRDLDRFDAQPIPGVEHAFAPFFSPDGEWIGYFDVASFELKKVSIRGGAPVTICDGLARGADWGSTNRVVFPRGNRTGLYLVSAEGGEPEVLTTLDDSSGERSHRFPHFLPGDHAVLFTVARADMSSFDDAHIAVVSRQDGRRKTLVRGGTHARYLPTGHIVYAHAGTLMAVPFDARELEVLGPPFMVLDGVVSSDVFGVAYFDVSANGNLAYAPGSPLVFANRLVWIDEKGRTDPLDLAPRLFQYLDISPDGEKVALTIGQANDDIWIYDLRRESLTRLTAGWDNAAPSWTADSKNVVFWSNRGGTSTTMWAPADGSASARPLVDASEFAWDHDGWTAYERTDAATGQDIWIGNLLDDSDDRLLVQTPFNDQAPLLSHSGRWMAYVSDESGRNEVYVRPFPGPGSKWRISTNGGVQPRWSEDDRELYFRNGDELMKVSISPDPVFTASKPEVVLDLEFFVPDRVDAVYDVHPVDGRLLMIQSFDPETTRAELNVVLNWFEELSAADPRRRD